MQIVETGNQAVLGFWKGASDARVLYLYNLTDEEQLIGIDMSCQIDWTESEFDGVRIRPHARYRLVEKQA